jgi:catechol 2,3-dioxygenase-like lactoylglutathione lyase family enzyme
MQMTYSGCFCGRLQDVCRRLIDAAFPRKTHMKTAFTISRLDRSAPARWFVGFALLLTCTVLLSWPATAQPVPENERTPIDIRRTTLIVRDIDKSLPLYRDALGLKVVYDQKIGGGTDANGKVTPPKVRLVLLRANDVFIGALGLMQRLDDPNPPAAANKRPMAGNIIMVINAKDLEERFEKIRATPNVTVATAPERVEYPGPNGSKIPVLFSAVYDPDGYFIEINKLLGAPAGASAPATAPSTAPASAPAPTPAPEKSPEKK